MHIYAKVLEKKISEDMQALKLNSSQPRQRKAVKIIK
jgi:hypothetical protein